MPTPAELQGLLLKEAVADIQAVAKQWTDSGLDRPVVFLVDAQDPCGADFVKTYVSEKDRWAAQAVRDGGVRPGTFQTVIKAMALEIADKALKVTPDRSLRKFVQPDQITVMVVAFGDVFPYHVPAT